MDQEGRSVILDENRFPIFFLKKYLQNVMPSNTAMVTHRTQDDLEPRIIFVLVRLLISQV